MLSWEWEWKAGILNFGSTMVFPLRVLTVKVEAKCSSGVGLCGDRMVRPRRSGGPRSGERLDPVGEELRSWKDGTLSSMEAMIELRSAVRVRVLERGLSGHRKEVPTSFEDSANLKLELSNAVVVSGMLLKPWLRLRWVLEAEEEEEASWSLYLKTSWCLCFSWLCCVFHLGLSGVLSLLSVSCGSVNLTVCLGLAEEEEEDPVE